MFYVAVCCFMCYLCMMSKNSRLMLLFLTFSLIFMSCASQINGRLGADSAGDFTVSASLQPRISAIIRSFQTLAGNAKPDGLIIDGGAIAQSMSSAPGIASVSFRNASPGSIEGPVKISKIGDFLAISGRSGFISFEQQNGAGRCSVNISLGDGPRLLSLISAEITDYLYALMAPLATGEALTKAEYIVLVGSVYGRGIADEISGSLIHAAVEFPGQVQSAQGGTFSGRRAEFDIPLLDLLVLETPLHYEVVWK